MPPLNTTIDNDTDLVQSDYGLSASVRFWSYLAFSTLSILTTLFLLYHLLVDRSLRRALPNHTLIVLLFIGLIYQLTNIPWILHMLHTGHPMFHTITFYLIWVFVDYAFYSMQVALFAWATIERHILIFHDRWMKNRTTRFCLHTAPIVAIPSYCFVYYVLIYFGPFCENSFDAFVAGGIYVPCLFSRTFWGTWDLLVHQVIPTLIIIVSSAGLIVRVMWQKRRLHQPMNWRRHRKMVVQLLSMSSVYMVFNFPWTFLVFAFQYGLSAEAASVPLVYAGYLYYYVIFIFPVVSCASSSELRQRAVQGVFFLCNRSSSASSSTATSKATTTDRTQKTSHAHDGR